jgi:hypothetical protein
MSFNRLKYDTCEIKQYNKESTGPGNYLYETPLICNNCFNPNPSIINQKTGVSINNNVDWRFYSGPVDIESELLNLNKRASRCPEEKNSLGNLENDKLFNFPNCYFPTEDTRLSNPSTNLRGTGWNRFDPLCHDPQYQISFPGESMTPTRLVVKDNHRASVVPPKVNDMNPYQDMSPCPKISPDVCGNYTGPLYQYDVCG